MHSITTPKKEPSTKAITPPYARPEDRRTSLSTKPQQRQMIDDEVRAGSPKVKQHQRTEIPKQINRDKFLKSRTDDGCKCEN